MEPLLQNFRVTISRKTSMQAIQLVGWVICDMCNSLNAREFEPDELCRMNGGLLNLADLFGLLSPCMNAECTMINRYVLEKLCIYNELSLHQQFNMDAKGEIFIQHQQADSEFCTPKLMFKKLSDILVRLEWVAQSTPKLHETVRENLQTYCEMCKRLLCNPRQRPLCVPEGALQNRIIENLENVRCE